MASPVSDGLIGRQHIEVQGRTASAWWMVSRFLEWDLQPAGLELIPVRITWLFLSIGGPFAGVFKIRGLLSGIYIRAPEFWKLPDTMHYLPYTPTVYHALFIIWVVVKIMVASGVPYKTGCRIILRTPKRDQKFDNHPYYESVSVSTIISTAL